MSKRSFGICLAFILAGLLMLIRTDAYYMPYILLSAFGIFCLFCNGRRPDRPALRSLAVPALISAFCGMMITFANHRIWADPMMPDERSALFFRAYKLYIILAIFAGSTLCILNILVFIKDHAGSFPLSEKAGDIKKPYLFFVFPFISMIIVYTVVWLCCYYPAIMSVDAIDQVSQILSGVYSNHHPIAHTLLIKLFFSPVYASTGDINRAVAAYILFQIIFMSATFAFTVKTMADLHMPRYALVIASVYYTLSPFHIMFSFSIWKDVVFGAFVTLFVVFFVRLTSIRRTVFDLVGFAVCCLAFCLFRSNGLFAFVIVTAAVFFAFKEQRRLFAVMACSIALALIIKHAVFPMFSVTAPDTAEMLSIPAQQVARTLVEGGDITEADRELISNIIDIDEAVRQYDTGISDPIKNLIRDFGNQQFISENKGAFLAMYLRTLIRNPLTFIIAFADQTKGYYNSGYQFMIWYWEVETNELGLVRQIGNARVNTAVGEYLWLFYNDPVFSLFVSIGFNVWILLLAFYKNAVSKNRTALITTVPSIAVIISLLVSTPAFSEFRYVYSLFTLWPLIIAMTLSKPVSPAAADTKGEHHEDHL